MAENKGELGLGALNTIAYHQPGKIGTSSHQEFR